MTDYNLLAAGTAECPAQDLQLKGEVEYYDDLDSAVQDWTDGYMAEYSTKFDELFYASMEDNSQVSIAAGVDLEATEAENGMYFQTFLWSWDTDNSNVDASCCVPELYYVPSVQVAALETLYYYGDYYINIYDGGEGGKYGWAWECDAGDDFAAALAVDSWATQSWYFPAEPETEADGETDATGDRWDDGEDLSAYAGFTDTPDTACFSEVEMKLGAANLAVASLAAALAASLAY